MILEQKIFSHLSTSTAITVTSSVSTRIYPLKLPQQTKYPAIIYTRYAGGQVNHLNGYSSLENPSIQIDVYADGYLEAKNIADRVHTAMIGATAFSAFLVSDHDVYEIELPVHRVIMDFRCWNKG